MFEIDRLGSKQHNDIWYSIVKILIDKYEVECVLKKVQLKKARLKTIGLKKD